MGKCIFYRGEIQIILGNYHINIIHFHMLNLHLVIAVQECVRHFSVVVVRRKLRKIVAGQAC